VVGRFVVNRSTPVVGNEDVSDGYQSRTLTLGRAVDDGNVCSYSLVVDEKLEYLLENSAYRRDS
jgi:hypothetical protein